MLKFVVNRAEYLGKKLAVETAKLLKQEYPDSKILFVGGHVAALPRESLEAEKCIDMVCLNEGVYAISNLLAVSDLNDQLYLSKVKGIGFKASDGSIIINSPERIVPKSQLEIDLPGMAWDLLPDIKKYRTAGWHSWPNNSIK